jgi:hypothetical protein
MGLRFTEGVADVFFYIASRTPPSPTRTSLRGHQEILYDESADRGINSTSHHHPLVGFRMLSKIISIYLANIFSMYKLYCAKFHVGHSATFID